MHCRPKWYHVGLFGFCSRNIFVCQIRLGLNLLLLVVTMMWLFCCYLYRYKIYKQFVAFCLGYCTANHSDRHGCRHDLEGKMAISIYSTRMSQITGKRPTPNQCLVANYTHCRVRVRVRKLYLTSDSVKSTTLALTWNKNWPCMHIALFYLAFSTKI